ncbi:MAG: ABC transporter ATP-binding protein [Sphaerochaetaceae bacterium]|nr:ABC transporter ATP-binding protein [Sphaerochaetaceae bacterium]
MKAEELKLGYEGQVVSSGISFSINSGDYLCIIGDNGAGKSTLIKAILGLHDPIGGKLSFVHDKKSIGYLPQRSDVRRTFPASVIEVVNSGAVNSLNRHFFLSRADKARALKNLEKMGLSGFERHSFQDLSGGQQQRVLLARALTSAKKILLLDEPVSGLDVHTASELYETIVNLNKEGMTIIMVTHDIHPALNSASHILHLGKKIFFGTREEFFESEAGKEYLKESGHHHHDD